MRLVLMGLARFHFVVNYHILCQMSIGNSKVMRSHCLENTDEMVSVRGLIDGVMQPVSRERKKGTRSEELRDLIEEKLGRLKKARIIANDEAEEFRLDDQIKELEKELEKITDERY